MGNMALVVFLRGVNVGGHRSFRPSRLTCELGPYEAESVGSAGTFVVFRPGPRAQFLAVLRRKLAFESVVALCDARDLIRLELEQPFRDHPSCPDTVQFVSILSRPGRRVTSLPIRLPENGEWFVRILGSANRLVYGLYRRHMKSIGYLGHIDRLFGAPAAARSWSTILSVLQILKSRQPHL